MDVNEELKYESSKKIVGGSGQGGSSQGDQSGSEQRIEVLFKIKKNRKGGRVGGGQVGGSGWM